MLKSNYLEKYTSNNSNKPLKKERRSNIEIFDEEEIAFQPIVQNLNTDNISDKVIWQEINQEENEDEFNAIRNAVTEDKEKLIPNKRQRHDSDSEDELDELLKEAQDKSDNQSGLNIELKFNKKSKKELLEKERDKQKKLTVFRDEKGRQVDKSETKEMKKKKLEKTNYENLSKWGKGIIQKEEKERKKEELKKSREEPFARYDIDFKVEEEYRKKERFEDPMKKILNLHKYERGSKISHDIKERASSRGFLLPNCKFAGPPNRFGITPGFRWDGVDRSTGFETKYLCFQNNRRAKEDEYHKIRTEDM
jgi:hypothetical protein